jgi:hypothetical protein
VLLELFYSVPIPAPSPLVYVSLLINAAAIISGFTNTVTAIALSFITNRTIPPRNQFSCVSEFIGAVYVLIIIIFCFINIPDMLLTSKYSYN